MFYEINDRNLLNALRVFDETFDGLVRASRKPTNKATCQSEYDFCKELPNGTWEIETKNEPGLKFNDLLDDIEQVIYNDPATIVTFKDGTKVCVKTCKGDTFSKETGLIYALVKRLYANDTDENGYLKSKGLGEKIAKVVEGAVDQKKLEAERKAKREAKKAKKSKLAKLANEVSEQAAKEAVNQIYDESSSQNLD